MRRIVWVYEAITVSTLGTFADCIKKKVQAQDVQVLMPLVKAKIRRCSSNQRGFRQKLLAFSMKLGFATEFPPSFSSYCPGVSTALPLV